MRWLAWPATQAILEAAVVLLVALLNPFQLNTWAEARNHALWQELHAHDYPEPNGGHGAGGAVGRNTISLVYFDDASLARNQVQRPMSAGVLELLLGDLVELSHPGPRAIFIDMVLTDAAKHGMTVDQIVADPAPEGVLSDCDRRSGATYSPFRCLAITVARYTHYAEWKDKPACQANPLAKIACIQRHGGTPIIFADPRLGARAAQGELARIDSPSLDALGTVAVTAPIAVEPDRYPIWLPRSEARYPYQPFWLSPAAALYAAWCGVDPSPKIKRCPENPATTDDTGQPGDQRRYEWDKARFGSELAIEWGIGPAPAKRDNGPDRLLTRSPCAGPDGSLAGNAMRLVRLMTAGLPWRSRAPCLYTRAFPYDIFQSAAFDQRDADALLANRLVIVGGQFSDSNDVLDTPPFGTMPGAYYHAMALDNLVQRGPDHAAPAEPVADWLHLSTGDLVNLLLFFPVALILKVATKASRADQFPRRIAADPRRSTVWRLGIITLGITGVLLALVLFLRADAPGQATAWFVPTRFNYVGATLIALFGIIELGSTACEPLLAALAHRFAPARIWQVLALLVSGQPVPTAADAGGSGADAPPSPPPANLPHPHGQRQEPHNG